MSTTSGHEIVRVPGAYSAKDIWAMLAMLEASRAYRNYQIQGTTWCQKMNPRSGAFQAGTLTVEHSLGPEVIILKLLCIKLLKIIYFLRK